MLIVDKPQDTSKNTQNKELKKSKRMAAGIIRVMRDRTGIDRDLSCITGTKMEHTERRFWENPKAKLCTPWRDSQLLWIHALLLSGFYNKQLTRSNFYVMKALCPMPVLETCWGAGETPVLLPKCALPQGWPLSLPSPSDTG